MKIDAAFRGRLKKKLLAELKKEHEREVTVRTALPLSPVQLSELQKAVPSLAHAELHNEVDQSIVAGMVIVDGSKIIDMSVKGSLQNLVATLI